MSLRKLLEKGRLLSFFQLGVGIFSTTCPILLSISPPFRRRRFRTSSREFGGFSFARFLRIKKGSKKKYEIWSMSNIFIVILIWCTYCRAPFLAALAWENETFKLFGIEYWEFVFKLQTYIVVCAIFRIKQVFWHPQEISIIASNRIDENS